MIKARTRTARPSRSNGNGKSQRRGKSAKQPACRFTPEELEAFREALLRKRAELTGDVSSLCVDTGLERSADQVDDASSGWEREFNFSFIENKHALLNEIDEALQRIENKTYGYCTATGKAISKARLECMPWASVSTEYARKREAGLV